MSRITCNSTRVYPLLQFQVNKVKQIQRLSFSHKCLYNCNDTPPLAIATESLKLEQINKSSTKFIYTMKATLFRTGSGTIPVHNSLVSGSIRLSVSSPFLIDSVAGEKNSASSPRISLKILRSSSDSDFINSRMKCSNNLRSRSSTLTETPELGIPPGGGMNNNRRSRGGGDGNENEGNWCKIRAYYQQMLKLNPTNSLILSNYARYLHEVEGDFVKAEEYYERAILFSPADGTVLCLYGKLIWETQRNQKRAKSYFQRAIQADQNDCMIMGSYAHFLWESDQEEETGDVSVAQTAVEAF